MTEAKKSGVDWLSFALGILFIITALLSFQDPAGNLLSIVIVFASFAIIKGVFEIFIRNKMKELTGSKSYALIILGVIDIVIGLYLLFNLNVALLILPYVFATWFIISSVINLFTLDLAKALNTAYFWFSAIINILSIVLGIFLLMNPITSALSLSFMVGFYFMMFGVLNLIYAFR